MTRRHLAPLMLVGTGSDVGKSILTAGFCRIFKQDGYHPAPFKAQNMALNSFVTADGLELGRAQAVQAEAAGIPCHTDMNPVLLKPSSDKTSQVVLHGRPIGNKDAYQYFRTVGRGELRGLYSSRIAADLHSAPNSNTERVHARIAGYDIENYSPEKATIGIVVIAKDSDGKNMGFKVSIPLIWEDNDWKIDTDKKPEPSPLTKEPTYIFKAQGGSQNS